MKKNTKKIIGVLTLLLGCLFTLCFYACKPAEAEIVAEDVRVEFDGQPHAIEATTVAEGDFSYEYIGLDNEYRSAFEPTQPGEYEVNISFQAFENEKQKSSKTVKLIIELPYTVDESGTVLSDYVGTQTDVVLPSTYRDKQLCALAEDTFYEKNIRSVTMPQSEFSVSPQAFRGSGISRLFISETSKLQSGDYAGITIEYCDAPKIVYEDTFGELYGIEKLTLPVSVQEIEEGALASLRVERLALYSKLPLKGIQLSSTIKELTVYPAEEGDLADGFFEGVKNVEKIVLAKGIDRIGARAFYGADSLKELDFDCVPTFIGEECFAEGAALARLTFLLGLDVEQLGVSAVMEAELKDGEQLSGQAFENCTALRKIILPDTVKVIGEYAFSGCVNLSEVRIPQYLESISYYAFYQCEALTSVVLPDTTQTVLAGAFQDCTGLKEIVLPDSLQVIENAAFSNCKSLESIHLPNALKKIGDYAINRERDISKTQQKTPNNIENSLQMIA